MINSDNITIKLPLSLDLLFDWTDGNNTGRISAFLDEYSTVDVNINRLNKEDARKIMYKLVDVIIDTGYYNPH